MLIICMLLNVINKVKATHQGQMKILISTHLILCILLQIINMVKVTYQGQSEKLLCSSNFM